jgi:uncharacterized membrane protein YccF (DUF307 family)
MPKLTCATTLSQSKVTKFSLIFKGKSGGLNVGMLLMSLIKPVEIRVTVAPVSISKFAITPFTFALINIPASGASLCTPTEPGVLSDVTGGESLKVAGKTTIEIQSDNFKCLNEAVVADINVDGILGLDFLKSQHAEIDMCNNTITIHSPFAVSMSRCDGLNVGMLLMSLSKPVEIRVTVAPVSISKFAITPFTFALINIPRGDVTCYGCGEKGHVVRFCPKGRRQHQNGGHA